MRPRGVPMLVSWPVVVGCAWHRFTTTSIRSLAMRYAMSWRAHGVVGVGWLVCCRCGVVGVFRLVCLQVWWLLCSAPSPPVGCWWWGGRVVCVAFLVVCVVPLRCCGIVCGRVKGCFGFVCFVVVVLVAIVNAVRPFRACDGIGCGAYRCWRDARFVD